MAEWKAYLNVRNGREPLVITSRKLEPPYVPVFSFDGDPTLDQIEDLEADMYKNGLHEVVFDDQVKDELKKLGLDELETIKIKPINQ